MRAEIKRGIIIEDQAIKGADILEVPVVLALETDDDLKAAQEFKGVCEGGTLAVQIRKIEGAWKLVICGQRFLELKTQKKGVAE